MRTTCLRCEQQGTRTVLVSTPNGGVCPVHDERFLQQLRDNAKAILGIPRRFIQYGKPNLHTETE